ncbi:AAA family ATPase, partial [Pseudomonas aeruginosa]|uniref:AAA family ATPase n=1 Tax=Pseudomonas aeruginosa TaxID=287 RepID=UPI003CC55991
HWRPNAGWQTEEQFSDVTLRLIGLLWSMMDGVNLLLLEEPELSLNDAIEEKIPYMIDCIQKQTKQRRQVQISTQSEP